MISINFTLVVQLFQFLILVWIMNKLLIQPVLRSMDDRKMELGIRRESITNLNKERDDRQAAYQARLAQAHQAATEERDRLMAEAKEEANRLKKISSDEAKKIMTDIRSQVKASAVEAKSTLKAQEEDLAEMLVASVMGGVR